MNFVERFRSWKTYRNTVNELSRLSNRELCDLGIYRGEINSLARKASFN